MKTTQNNNTIQVEFENLFQGEKLQGYFIDNLMHCEAERISPHSTCEADDEFFSFIWKHFCWEKFWGKLCSVMIPAYIKNVNNLCEVNFELDFKYIKTIKNSLGNELFTIEINRIQYEQWVKFAGKIDTLDNLFYKIAEDYPKVKDMTIDNINESEKMNDLIEFLDIDYDEYKEGAREIFRIEFED